MKLANPDRWEEYVAANPLPEGCGPEPEDWPPYAEMTEAQRSAGYGAIVIIAAGRWMDAMEDELADTDETVAGVAERCFREVNQDLGSSGLTGFQYGVAASMLAEVWEHGEELRRWHNLATQLGTEGERANESGGVLNPALLNIEVDE